MLKNFQGLEKTTALHTTDWDVVSGPIVFHVLFVFSTLVKIVLNSSLLNCWQGLDKPIAFQTTNRDVVSGAIVFLVISTSMCFAFLFWFNRAVDNNFNVNLNIKFCKCEDHMFFSWDVFGVGRIT